MQVESGSVVDRTFRAGEKFPRVHTEVKNVQFLYDDGSETHFMDEQTYEQFALPRGEVEDERSRRRIALFEADKPWRSSPTTLLSSAMGYCG